MARRKARSLREIYDSASGGHGITDDEAVTLAQYVKRQVLLAGDAKKLAQQVVSTAHYEQHDELRKQSNMYISDLMELNAEIKKER